MSWELNLLLRLLLLKIYCICVSQGSSLPESYPDPTTEGGFVECGVPSEGFLCDTDQMLTTSEQESIISLLTSVQKDIPCPCGTDRCTEDSVGFVIGVFVGRNLQYEGHSMQDSLLHVDNTLLKDWSEHSECRNQAILILSVQQSQSRVALDDLAEGFVLKRERTQIADLMDSLMFQGSLTLAINTGVNRTVETLKLRPEHEDAAMLMLMGIFGGICLVTCVLSLSAAYMIKLTARHY